MSLAENRTYPRYVVPHSDNPAYEYEVVMTKTKVHLKATEEKSAETDYLGFIKNISVDGLCFSTDAAYENGQIVEMEVDLPGADKSIHMEGEVQWNESVDLKGKKNQDNELATFKTGIKVFEVDGKRVCETVHFEENYQLQWSIVLDSIFGNFRLILNK